MSNIVKIVKKSNILKKATKEKEIVKNFQQQKNVDRRNTLSWTADNILVQHSRISPIEPCLNLKISTLSKKLISKLLNVTI